jgi:glycosyltransferase involved in cell wall biosynthesis
MKIAYIAAASILSNTANSIQVMKVCQALTQNGETVELMVPGQQTTNWEKLTQHYGLTTIFPIHWVRNWKPLKRFDFIFLSLLKARRNKVDVVFTRMIWAAFWGLHLNFPVVLELHDIPAGRFGLRLLDKIVRSKKKRKIVFITSALRKIIASKLRNEIHENIVIIAPDGVDLERFKDLPEPAAARKLLNLQESITAVYSGGFYEGRGLDTLFALGQAFPEVQFLWIGGNREAVSKWNDKIRKLKVKNITLTGFVDNEKLPLYQASADILLMPYGKVVAGSSGGNIAEVSSPMKMFEYMAAGRAILASDLPVLGEVLHQSNALFYSSDDFSDLKLKFSILLSNQEKRDSLGKQAKLDVQQYTWKIRMEKIIRSFNEVA